MDFEAVGSESLGFDPGLETEWSARPDESAAGSSRLTKVECWGSCYFWSIRLRSAAMLRKIRPPLPPLCPQVERA